MKVLIYGANGWIGNQFIDFLKQTEHEFVLGLSRVNQIKDVLDNPNSGKYRMEQTYGPDAEGNYVLDVSSQNTLIPSNTYKKTSLCGLYYDIIKVTSETDEYGYPVVGDSFQFTQEEV